MRKLGISIYPDQASRQEVKDYILLSSKYGFSRIFTCLISTSDNQEQVLEEFTDIVQYAKGLGFEVIADVDSELFSKLGLVYTDLEFFHKLGLSGIRLDMGFSGMEEAAMSYNKYGLDIELNISNGTKYLENILSYVPNKERIIGCHNFYPHRYSGLDRDHFIKCSKQFKDEGVRTAAFVCSANADFGPWPVSEGLCTMEEHRELPIATQAKDLFNTDLVDDVIIANMFASEEELKVLGSLNRNLLELKVKANQGLSDVETKIIFDEPHFNRGDVSSYMIRSTQSRVKYKGAGFPPVNTPNINKGDILIESDLYTRYAGELQLAKLPMENSGKTNVVARVVDEEVFLIDKIRPWQSFRFVK